MVPELPEPPLDVLVCEVLGDVVDEESAHSPPVVGGGDGAVSLLTRRVPDLGLDGLPVNLKDRGLGNLAKIDISCLYLRFKRHPIREYTN